MLLARIKTACAVGMILLMGACQDDVRRLESLEHRADRDDQTVETITVESASSLAASKAYTDGVAKALSSTVQEEAVRAQQAEAAEAKARLDGDAQALQASTVAAKAYTDQAVAAVQRPTETHLKNVTTGRVLGKQRATYVTAETVGGEVVDIDWVTRVRRAWDRPCNSLANAHAFIRSNNLPSSLLQSSRYISATGTLMQIDSDQGQFDAQSEEDSQFNCVPLSYGQIGGFKVTETVPNGGATDSGIPVKEVKPKELRAIDVSIP